LLEGYSNGRVGIPVSQAFETKHGIEIGHARVAAARKARLETVPVYIADLDDDTMLRSR
jgi:hypothetical protein